MDSAATTRVTHTAGVVRYAEIFSDGESPLSPRGNLKDSLLEINSTINNITAAIINIKGSSVTIVKNAIPKG